MTTLRIAAEKNDIAASVIPITIRLSGLAHHTHIHIHTYIHLYVGYVSC